MATKRAPPKDLDVSSPQSKQLRLETMSQSAFYNTKPVSNVSHTDNRSSLPATELHISAPIPISPLTSNVSSSPTHVIGVPTWSSPGKTSLDFHSSQGDTGYVLPIAPTQKPPDVTPAFQQDSYVAPLFVVPAGMKQEIGVSGSAQFVHSGLTKQNLVPASTIDNSSVALSSGGFATSNSPSYNILCPMPNVGGVIPTSELRPYTSTTSELSSLSSSQIPHLSVSSLSSHVGSSTSSPTLSSINRQPVCLVGNNGKSEPKKQKNNEAQSFEVSSSKVSFTEAKA